MDNELLVFRDPAGTSKRHSWRSHIVAVVSSMTCPLRISLDPAHTAIMWWLHPVGNAVSLHRTAAVRTVP
jgi:hypothetical protein